MGLKLPGFCSIGLDPLQEEALVICVCLEALVNTELWLELLLLLLLPYDALVPLAMTSDCKVRELQE